MTKSIAALALTGALAGCGGGRGEDGCTPLEGIEVVDVDGVENEERMRAIRAAIDDFATVTGRDCLDVDTIKVVRDIVPSFGKGTEVDVAGRFDSHRRTITVIRGLSLDAIAEVVTHEFCHALDFFEDLTTSSPDLWEPKDDADYPTNYPESLATGEVFARQCTNGPSPPLDHALRQAYGLKTAPRQEYLDEIVFPNAPTPAVPLAMDLDIDLTTETWTPPTQHEAYVEWFAGTGDGLAVVVQEYPEEGIDSIFSVHFLAPDPLRETAVVALAPFGEDSGWRPFAYWGAADAVYLGDDSGRFPWVRVGVDGQVSTVGPIANAEVAHASIGVVVDGVGLGMNATNGKLSAAVLESGTLISSGLEPDTGLWAAWPEGDSMALHTYAGTWRGHPATHQWWFTPHAAPGRPIPWGERAGLGSYSLAAETGHVTLPVMTDADGIDHYPPTLANLGGYFQPVGGVWRGIEPNNEGLTLITPRP